ncbi:MAG: ATP-grasp domain-containing protein [Coriobacteriales bacterium]|jgi:pyrrolysine biosynthesis protein PylC|nr:ATP-grasp domain-containing protein [Coriobacteriales bacterium]
MNMLVIGGRLQGAEIAFLGKEAGFQVTVLDREQEVLASQLGDAFVQINLQEATPGLFAGYDLVFPATENLETLQLARKLAEEAGLPFLFDEQAFYLTRSKTKTNRFLQDIGVRTPPALCAELSDIAPLFGSRRFIVKPDKKSGSKGVCCFCDKAAALAYLDNHEDCFGQVFLEGPLYSVEVICDKTHVTPFAVTEVVVEASFDSHRIIAPAVLSVEIISEIQSLASQIGRALRMKGIFDVELVLHDSRLYVLELDARMPSQTPLAVYYATGVNFVSALAACFLGSGDAGLPNADGGVKGADTRVVLQHVYRDNRKKTIELIGEGRLLAAPPLIRADGFCGADVALVSNSAESTYATLLTLAETHSAAEDKMERVLETLKSREGANHV